MQAINNFPDKHNLPEDKKCVILQEWSRRAIRADEKSCPEAQPAGISRYCISGRETQTELMENQFVHGGKILIMG